MSPELEINSSLGPLKALQWGNPNSPRKILAVHGWLDHAGSFWNLAPHLVSAFQNDCHIVAIDLPGHGQSPHYGAGVPSYPFLDGVHWTLTAQIELGWDRCHYLTHSMGSAIACFIGGLYPDKLINAVLVDALGPLPGPDPSQPGLSVDRLAEHLKALQLKPKDRFYQKVEEAQASLARQLGLEEKWVQPLVERSLQKTDQGWTWSADPRLKLPSAMRMTEPQILALLGRIQCPVIFYGSPQGKLMQHPAFQARVDAVRNLEIHPINGPHHLHITHGDQIAPEISRFMAATQ